MFDTVTVQDIFSIHQDALQLEWLAGKNHKHCVFRREPGDLSCLVGFLNFVHPQQVTVLGEREFSYLAKLDVNSYTESIQHLFNTKPTLIIIADDQNVASEIGMLAQDTSTPLMRSPLSGQTIIDHLTHYLTNRLAASITVHGVFMEVFDIGVLLTGASGVGKSELALELVNRGHRLIADDCPLFSRITPDKLTGTCPTMLQDFLEVRGIGVIDIKAMFGSTAVKKSKYLQLIVHVIAVGELTNTISDRLTGMHRQCELLGLPIPEVTIPAAPGRSLAILVEAAVRNQILKLNGYVASEIFERRQRQEMDAKSS